MELPGDHHLAHRGLEVAIVLHAILNTGALLGASLLRVDLGGQLSDRSSGVGSPILLVPALAVIVITAIIWWCTRKTGPVLSPPSPPEHAVNRSWFGRDPKYRV
ncbi:hypothetical protein GCM10023238_08930 [Streptomyces heliomycini]